MTPPLRDPLSTAPATLEIARKYIIDEFGPSWTVSGRAERLALLIEHIVAPLRAESDTRVLAQAKEIEGLRALLQRFLDCPEIADAGQENLDEETETLERETRRALSASSSVTT